jgi:hypothetical protein
MYQSNPKIFSVSFFIISPKKMSKILFFFSGQKSEEQEERVRRQSQAWPVDSVRYQT